MSHLNGDSFLFIINMNIFKRLYNYFLEKVEKQKEIIKEKEIERKVEKALNNVCKSCNGIGIVDHENAEFRTVKHWCNCKVLENGRPPGDAWSFDIRWRECYKMIIMSNSEFDKPNMTSISEIKTSLPRPELVFEPYIKLYIHEDNKVVKIVTFEKKHGYNRFLGLGNYKPEVSNTKKVFYWDHIDVQSWITDEDNKFFLSELRDIKLKELGI
jgi:hypothetical protein